MRGSPGGGGSNTTTALFDAPKQGSRAKKKVRKNAKGGGGGLKCDKYDGGPSQEIAEEMVYWRDGIPSDAPAPHVVVSPLFASNIGQRPKKKYLTFEPDFAGFNNVRMILETAVGLAFAMGRTLVLPPEHKIFGREDGDGNNRFTFHDFYPLDSIVKEAGLEVISMKEFLEREALTGQFKDQSSGMATFPPGNQTEWGGQKTLKEGSDLWFWLRKASGTPHWKYNDCVVGFASNPGTEAGSGGGLMRLSNITDAALALTPDDSYNFVDKPTPVDGSPPARLAEVLGHRKRLCHYDHHWQNSQNMHFMGGHESGTRLLIHFYGFIFFEDWRQDLALKRFIRDHLRYTDEIQCAAARVVNAVREMARENGDPDGAFDSFHVRRGDFAIQMKEIVVDAKVIYDNVHDVLVENSTVFVATDERDLTFFDPLRKHYNLYFLSDFEHLVKGLNKNTYGMLDQLIASRGRAFVGAYKSTLSGYVNRIRGYHSQKQELPGYEKGQVNSYYYTPTDKKYTMKHYHSVQKQFWEREFPIAWRDIDHDSDAADIIS